MSDRVGGGAADTPADTPVWTTGGGAVPPDGADDAPGGPGNDGPVGDGLGDDEPGADGEAPTPAPAAGALAR
jgi:hypothetical protein